MVVDALKDAGMHMEVGTGEDARAYLRRLRSAVAARVAVPGVPHQVPLSAPAPSVRWGEPAILQRILEDISQRLVGRE